MTFDSLRIDSRCLQYLKSHNITEPTPIQQLAIPVAAEGHDLVAIAQTGTGKTLAFGLPALSRLAELPRGTTGMLILAPTRELVQQVHDVVAPLAKLLKLTTACVYGGVGFTAQEQALRKGASIVVACPGRLLDHMQRKNTNFSKLSILVLDEADRMLDMGFMPDIKRILSQLPRERQTMMFSATFPSEIAGLANNMMRNPQRVETSPVVKAADAVRQLVYTVALADKVELTKHILAKEEVGSTIIFVRTKRAADRLATVLDRAAFHVDCIHGGQSQNRRKSAIDGFRTGHFRILVATDVAARGLDIKGVSHVINYDIPATPDDYIHRIGRTARASATGDAITFVTPEDAGELRCIEKVLNKKIDRESWKGVIIEDPKPKAFSLSGRGGRRRMASTGGRSW
ncbi:MAG TPA: DEAD/DEAH box helicase [Candidatus Sumerlaeota bacterium]|nr:DEAD/DEAH box helicase [Candidatus Sumerlaeota bacterium]